MSDADSDLLRIEIKMNLRWRFARGHYFGTFYRHLVGGVMVGIRCPGCGRVYVPPRPVCGDCYRPMHEWVEVGPAGTIRAFTVMHLPIVDPITGRPRPTPYAMALIQLDGADTTVNHYVEPCDFALLSIGGRVEAVFREERTGSMSDIACFRVLEG